MDSRHDELRSLADHQSQGHGERGRHWNEAVVRPGVLQVEVDAWLGAGVESGRCRNDVWSGRLSDLGDELKGGEDLQLDLVVGFAGDDGVGVRGWLLVWIQVARLLWRSAEDEGERQCEEEGEGLSRR